MSQDHVTNHFSKTYTERSNRSIPALFGKTEKHIQKNVPNLHFYGRKLGRMCLYASRDAFMLLDIPLGVAQTAARRLRNSTSMWLQSETVSLTLH